MARPTIVTELYILKKYRLTPEEWLITQLLFLGDINERSEYDPDISNPIYEIYQYGGIMTRTLRDNLVSLQEKHVLTKEYKIPETLEMFDPEGVVFNLNFFKDWRQYSGILGRELMAHYPEYLGGLPMTNTVKYFADGIDGLYRCYGRMIKWNVQLHEKVLDILDRSLEAGLIRYGICEFVLSRKWERLEIELDKGTRGEQLLDIFEEI